MTRSEPIGPFGEALTWPSPSSGAVAVKNSGWRAIHSRRCPSISSKTLPIGQG
jgi:hypothetical protein